MAKEKKTKLPQNTLEKLVPIMVVVSIGLAFLVGVLWQKVSNLEGGGTKIAADSPTQPTDTAKPINGKLTKERASKLGFITEEDHTRGDRDAKVTIIEYSDFECPYCASFHKTAVQTLDEYEGQVSWVYRHFPLDSIHSRARSAANASECVVDIAGNDAFWEFGDILFADQQSALTDDGLAAAAADVGVESKAFADCTKSEKFADKVEDQYQSGLSAGVTGTPGNFIINNETGDVWFIPGAVGFDSLKTTIDEALAS